MEPFYDYKHLLSRIEKLEDTCNDINNYIKSLNPKIKKNENSLLVKLAIKIYDIVDFILKPIIWVFSLCIIERNIKPFSGQIKIPDRLNSSPKT